MIEDARSVTELLGAWNGGQADAVNHLMPRVAAELREVAGRFLQKESADHTLQPTALVNEVYLRLLERRQVNWADRAHFIAFAARTMRYVLVDHARVRKAEKRGGGEFAESLSRVALVSEPSGRQIDILELNEALKKLTQLNPDQAQIVELRYFAGMTVDETAEAMGIGRSTVARYWALAKAFLFRELNRA